MAFKVNQNVWTGEIWDGRHLLGPATIWFTFRTISKSWIIKKYMSLTVNHRFGNSFLRTYVLKWLTFLVCPYLWVIRVSWSINPTLGIFCEYVWQYKGAKFPSLKRWLLLPELRPVAARPLTRTYLKPKRFSKIIGYF